MPFSKFPSSFNSPFKDRSTDLVEIACAILLVGPVQDTLSYYADCDCRGFASRCGVFVVLLCHHCGAPFRCPCDGTCQWSLLPFQQHRQPQLRNNQGRALQLHSGQLFVLQENRNRSHYRFSDLSQYYLRRYLYSFVLPNSQGGNEITVSVIIGQTHWVTITFNGIRNGDCE